MRFVDKEVNPKQLSPLNLAFIGDCIYEILVRETLVLAGAYIVGRLLINYLCVSPFAEILIVSVAVDTIVVVASFYFILSESERSFVINFIKNKIHR